jgi:DNA repair exonuclease SbcCD nuclease subunit
VPGAFRFLHLADLHLETSFGGRPATRDRLRRATREAFEAAVELALRERLHAVLVAGDLFDDELLSPRTELWFVRQVRRLAEAGVWFLAACGNHDPGGDGFRMARIGLAAPAGSLPEPWRARVHLFLRAEPERVTVTDGAGAAVGVVVGAGHATDREPANLAARFPRAGGPLPVVGCLHTQIDTAAGAERHERYAPSSRADYERLGYAYFALGHVHQPGRAVEGLPVYYAGNLQGRSPRETGPRGGYLVEARAGAASEPRFVRLAPLRWARLSAAPPPPDGSLAALAEALGRRIAKERESEREELAVVVELAGETPLARRLRSEDERAALEEDLAAGTGALEVQLRDAGLALPVDRALLRAAPSVLQTALELAERAARDDALLRELAPDPLARGPRDDPARLAHLRGLLPGLPEDLVARFLPDPRREARP